MQGWTWRAAQRRVKTPTRGQQVTQAAADAPAGLVHHQTRRLILPVARLMSLMILARRGAPVLPDAPARPISMEAMFWQVAPAHRQTRTCLHQWN